MLLRGCQVPKCGSLTSLQNGPLRRKPLLPRHCREPEVRLASGEVRRGAQLGRSQFQGHVLQGDEDIEHMTGEVLFLREMRSILMPLLVPSAGHGNHETTAKKDGVRSQDSLHQAQQHRISCDLREFRAVVLLGQAISHLEALLMPLHDLHKAIPRADAKRFVVLAHDGKAEGRRSKSGLMSLRVGTLLFHEEAAAIGPQKAERD
eukprot:scaffold2771_cov252-Pinguiococcus_pyrenoidosus.AAC.43